MLIYYGYDLIDQINILKLRNQLKLITIPFIFDSHKGAIENFNAVKKSISEVYFNISISLLNKNDAFLLFNKEAVEELNIKKPYLVTRPGMQADNLEKNVYHKKIRSLLFYILEH